MFDNHSSTGKIIKAILPVHPMGNPLDLDELYKFSDNNLVVVEDMLAHFAHG